MCFPAELAEQVHAFPQDLQAMRCVFADVHVFARFESGAVVRDLNAASVVLRPDSYVQPGFRNVHAIHDRVFEVGLYQHGWDT